MSWLSRFPVSALDSREAVVAKHLLQARRGRKVRGMLRHVSGRQRAASRSILVFYIPMLIVLMLIAYVPGLTLWLPYVLLGK